MAVAWRRWRENRPPAQLVHLDTAAAGRCSTATLRAAAGHAEREAAAALLQRSTGADGAPALRAALEQTRVGAIADASGNIGYLAAS